MGVNDICNFEKVCTIPFESIRYLRMFMDKIGTNVYMHLMERGVFLNFSSIETSCALSRIICQNTSETNNSERPQWPSSMALKALAGCGSKSSLVTKPSLCKGCANHRQYTQRHLLCKNQVHTYDTSISYYMYFISGLGCIQHEYNISKHITYVTPTYTPNTGSRKHHSNTIISSIKETQPFMRFKV